MYNITHIYNPIWDKKTRQWVLGYTVHDTVSGKEYIQKVKCEALVSAVKYINMVQKVKQ